jgi:hypothetical protein
LYCLPTLNSPKATRSGITWFYFRIERRGLPYSL